MGAVPKISINNVGVTFTDQPILENIQLDVAKGEIVCLIGASGCGKSTLLNAVAGLVHLTTGEILVDGRTIQGPAADRVMVFQDDAVFPLDARAPERRIWAARERIERG